MSEVATTTTTANVKTTDKQTKALEILNAGVMERLTSDTWKQALDFYAKFHNYSFNNRFLIMLQNPEATHVAGYNKWIELGRQVRKGEKGIAILAPMIVKVKNEETGEKEPRVVGFRSVYVFDISQTDGDEVPTLPSPKLLEGFDDEAQELCDRLEKFIADQGWTFEVEDQGKGVRGSWNPLTKTVTVNPELPKLARAKTLAHEIGHALGKHTTTTARDVGELEAESTAYLVLNAFGLDSSEYSFDYIAHWAKEEGMASALLDAGKNASTYADTIIAAITATNQAIAA